MKQALKLPARVQEEILEKEVPPGSSPETDLGNDFYWSFCRLVDMTLAHELSSVLRQRRIGWGQPDQTLKIHKCNNTIQ